MPLSPAGIPPELYTSILAALDHGPAALVGLIVLVLVAPYVRPESARLLRAVADHLDPGGAR